MLVLVAFDPSPQYGAALLIAAPLLGAGIVLALIVTRASAWYARRWHAAVEEESLTERFLTDRLFPNPPYGILAQRRADRGAGTARGGRADDGGETEG